MSALHAVQVAEPVAVDPTPAVPTPDTAFGRFLERVCSVIALAGGLILVGIVLVSSASVIGRSLPLVFAELGLRSPFKGIPGDIEIVELGCAVAIFFYLPLCQLKRGNVLVGVFTKNLRPRYRALFDLAANLLFLVLTAALAVQLGYGTADKFRDQDTTMVLRIPEGWAYAIALAAVWLLVIVTAYTVIRSVMEIVGDRAIGPAPSGEH